MEGAVGKLRPANMTGCIKKGRRTKAKRRCYLRSRDEKGRNFSKRKEVHRCDLQLLGERLKKLQIGRRGK
jgi:hypothetical protein